MSHKKNFNQQMMALDLFIIIFSIFAPLDHMRTTQG